MAALLAIAMFAVFITADWLISRRRARADAPATSPSPILVPAHEDLIPDGEPEPQPVFVAGYEMPERLHYHRGHTWARIHGSDTATVGVDDFGRRLLGTARDVELPAVGDYVYQGGKGATVVAQGRAADVVAPVAGEVIAVNEAIEDDPELLSKDPYGRGWLFKIRSPNLPLHVRNLLSGSLARKWIEDAGERLDHRLMAMTGSVLADGGEPAHDFGDHVDTEAWGELVESFLLTQGCERTAS